MSSNVLVSLLVSVVFRNEVEVVSSDDDGSVHLGGHNSTGHNLTSDGDVTDKWALPVNVVALDGLFRGLEAQADLLGPSLGLLTLGLSVGENVRLLKVSKIVRLRADQKYIDIAECTI